MFAIVFRVLVFFAYLVLAPVAIWLLDLGAIGWLVYATFWALVSFLEILTGRRDLQLNEMAAQVLEIRNRVTNSAGLVK